MSLSKWCPELAAGAHRPPPVLGTQDNYGSLDA